MGPVLKARLVVALAVLLAACAAQPSPSLPTLVSYNGACRGIGLHDTILAGSATDPRVAWLVGPGGRREIIWPPGFRARFSPDLEVLDASGTVVFRAGDQIDGGCTAGPNDHPASLLLIVPPAS